MRHTSLCGTLHLNDKWCAALLLPPERIAPSNGGKERMKMVSGDLLSGLIGAVLATILNLVYVGWRHRCERNSLLDGVIAECDYNLSILAEVLEGTLERGGSFKRMSVEYLKSVRNFSVAYSMDREVLIALSRAIIDLEVYNREADYVFDGNSTTCVYSGIVKELPVLITKEPDLRDISRIMTNARNGVKGSLDTLKKTIAEKR